MSTTLSFFLLAALCLLPIAVATDTDTSGPLNTDSPDIESIVLTADNHVALEGDVNRDSVSKWIQALYERAEKDSELFVYIDSGGGSVDDGLHLIEQMHHLRTMLNVKLRCIARRAYSMAFGIFELGCDERLITENSVLMQHQATYGIGGSHHMVRSRLALYQKQIEKFDAQQAEKLQMSVEAFSERINNEWWLHGDECIDANAADAFVTVGCDPDLAQDIVEDTTRIQFGPFVFTKRVRKSRCPLIGVLEEIEDDDNDDDN